MPGAGPSRTGSDPAAALADPPAAALFACVIALACCTHVAFGGGRVAVSLLALDLGASPLVVGTLMSTLALLPMLLAVAFGRLGDRVGVRTPMTIGALAVALGTALPFLSPTLPALYACVVLAGAGYTAWLISVQHWLGAVVAPERRTAHFTHLALGIATSNLFGPIIAGVSIDAFGHRVAFAILAAFGLVTVLALRRLRLTLPARAAHRADGDHRVLDLLRDAPLRRILLASALLSVAWDLHMFVVPILGTQRGFSASEIGFVLGAFGAATLLVRLLMTWLSRHVREWALIGWAIGIGLVVYALYPFAPGFASMVVLSFVLGLGLGASQPNVMSLLHHAAPPERIGEAVGLRLSLVNASHVVLPLAFGAAGSAFGVAPVFWSMSAMLAAGGWWIRKPSS